MEGWQGALLIGLFAGAGFGAMAVYWQYDLWSLGNNVEDIYKGVHNQQELELAELVCDDGRVVELSQRRGLGLPPYAYMFTCERENGWHDLYYYQLVTNEGTMEELLADKYWKLRIETIYEEQKP